MQRLSSWHYTLSSWTYLSCHLFRLVIANRVVPGRKRLSKAARWGLQALSLQGFTLVMSQSVTVLEYISTSGCAAQCSSRCQMYM